MLACMLLLLTQAAVTASGRSATRKLATRMTQELPLQGKTFLITVRCKGRVS